MTSKTLAVLIVIFAAIFVFPIAIGIVGGLAGIIFGLFGAIFGLFASLVGKIFYWPFSFHCFNFCNLMVVLIIALVIVVKARSKRN